MGVSEKPLRILVVVNLPWDERLGAIRVWLELADEWRKSGNVVQVYSLSDAFRDAHAGGARLAIRQAIFTHKAAAGAC